MQGIPFFQYKCLLGYLDKIKEESELLDLPAAHVDAIEEHKEILKTLYSSYEQSVKELSILVTQYKVHHNAVRRLAVQHKRTKKESAKAPPGISPIDIVPILKIAQ